MKYLKITNSGKLEAVRGCFEPPHSTIFSNHANHQNNARFQPSKPPLRDLKNESVDVVLNGLVGYEYTSYL